MAETAFYSFIFCLFDFLPQQSEPNDLGIIHSFHIEANLAVKQLTSSMQKSLKMKANIITARLVKHGFKLTLLNFQVFNSIQLNSSYTSSLQLLLGFSFKGKVLWSILHSYIS